jgi:antitoxin component YwqK of YwqJK toxin-antitoxin module
MIFGCLGLGVFILLGLVYVRQDGIRVVKGRHENGAAKEIWLYKRNILGKTEKYKEIAYFENGIKEYEVDYKNGRVEGWGKMWYESGQLRWEATYKANEPHGVRKAYYENGQLFCLAEYENGVLLRRKNWDEQGNEIYIDMDRPDPF